jgi:hypothetical protein
MQAAEQCAAQVQWSLLYSTTVGSTRDQPERGVGRGAGRDERG